MNTLLGRKSSSSIQAFTVNQRERVSGFTLLELLVVITIIVVLIGFLFPAFRGIQDQAKRTQAKNDLNQIVTAISAFYTEYGYYPVPASTITDSAATYPARGQYQDSTNNVVFDILRYDISRDPTTVPARNPRQVVFIEPPIAKDQANPKLGIRFTSGCWYDPWGYTYNVTIDAQPGTARVRVCDKGEPGRNDIFEIQLSNGYGAAGDLGGSHPGGGNIQLHKCP